MDVREQLVGTWRLVSFEYVLANGASVEAYGPKPVGILFYDEHGNMAAQIMSPDRRRFATGDRRNASHEELAGAVEGYIAYFGTYEIDEAQKCVIHVERGDVFPNAVGTTESIFFGPSRFRCRRGVS